MISTQWNAEVVMRRHDNMQKCFFHPEAAILKFVLPIRAHATFSPRQEKMSRDFEKELSCKAVVQVLIAFDKGERLHSAVAFENFGAFIDTDLAPPKNSSGAKLFREIIQGNFHRPCAQPRSQALSSLPPERGCHVLCFYQESSFTFARLASWCASLFSLTFSSRLVCFLVEFWTLLPCLFHMFTITIA